MSDNAPILTPKELLDYRRATGALSDFEPPQIVVFAPQKSLAKFVLHRYFTKRVKGFLGELYLLKKFRGQIALSTGFGIGAPAIAGLTDEFVALGATKFALIGMAGGLQQNLDTGSLVLSTAALRGDGVSRHYLPTAEAVKTSPEMLDPIGSYLQAGKYHFFKGPTWTTDAPFRELRRDVLENQNKGILAVDMEAAGMLSVAEANNLQAVVLFSIADTLSNGIWKMSTDLRPAQAGLTVLFEALLSALNMNK